MVVQREFLDRLKAIEAEQANNIVILLVMPVIRLICAYAESGQLANADGKFNFATIWLFKNLTEQFPDAFDKHYIACSKIMPEVMLQLRNMITGCKPKDIQLPSVSKDFQTVKFSS